MGDDPIDELRTGLAALADRIEHQLVVEAASHDHRSAIEKALGVGCAAPHQHTVPAQPRVQRIELPAHAGVDAVAADEHVARHRGAGAVTGALEAGPDRALTLGYGLEHVSRMDRLAPKPFNGGITQHALQATPVDRQLRHLVARLEPAWFAPDLLAETVGIDQLACAHTDGVEALEQAELAQLGNGVRQYVDADAQLADPRGGLEDLAWNSTRLEHQGKREPADASADDDNAHRLTSPTPAFAFGPQPARPGLSLCRLQHGKERKRNQRQSSHARQRPGSEPSQADEPVLLSALPAIGGSPEGSGLPRNTPVGPLPCGQGSAEMPAPTRRNRRLESGAAADQDRHRGGCDVVYALATGERDDASSRPASAARD